MVTGTRQHDRRACGGVDMRLADDTRGLPRIGSDAIYSHKCRRHARLAGATRCALGYRSSAATLGQRRDAWAAQRRAALLGTKSLYLYLG